MPYRCGLSCRYLSARYAISRGSRDGHCLLRADVSVRLPRLSHCLQNLTYQTARHISTPSQQRRKDLRPTSDTIYALSTASGKAAIAIIRVSGPACLDIYGGLCPNKPFPHPRVATLRKLRDPINPSRIIDSGALVLYFPSPRTVTGDDLLELHVHGGPAIVRSVLEAIPQCIDTRPRRRNAEFSRIRAAESGEFTKRAFYNGRLDLTGAEALGDILSAETEQQRRLAVSGEGSGLATRYEAWRQMLLSARGEIEALIDFSEDQHFDESPADLLQSVSTQVSDMCDQIVLHMENASRGEMLRNGINVALLGAPNAGKSSLLNRIVGREAAIVSSEAGTTRDIVDVSVDIGGWLVRLGDMAGLRGSQQSHFLGATMSGKFTDLAEIGVVEQEGIRRARQRALESDLVIVLIAVEPGTAGSNQLALNPELVATIRECHVAGKSIVFAVNKMDLVREQDRQQFQDAVHLELESVCISAGSSNVFFISCRNTTAYPTADDFVKHDSSDTKAIQTFLNGLVSTFSAMTAAMAGENNASLTPQEAQSYWTAALSVTHRQREHLSHCLIHLQTFLRHNNLTGKGIRNGIHRSPRNMLLSHYVDNHADLVGEVAYTTANEKSDIGCSHTRDQAATPLGLGPDDLPHASADTVADIQNYSTHEAENEFDIVMAAEHLRYAADYLAKITGRGEGGDVEDVLGVVFEK